MHKTIQIQTILTILFIILITAFAAPDGEALYQQSCASCHGTALQGGNAQSLVDGVWQFGASRGYIYRNIEFGIPTLGMPSYKNTLNRDQIQAIVDFLEEAEKKANPQKPPLPGELETLDYKINVEVVAEGLNIPWAITFIDENNILVTERPGPLRFIRNGKLDPEPVKNTPEVVAEGQGGMLDVTVDPDYDKNGWIYLAYSHGLPSQSESGSAPVMTRIVRGKIMDHTWTNQEVIFEAPHETYRSTRYHFGCRIVFDDKGYLYFGIGDRGQQNRAQDLSMPNGKIFRIHKDGKIPEDNPFVDEDRAMKAVFASGIRNPQGMAVHPATDQLWETEHGPLGGDEINLIRPGVNYGWPEISYGKNYSGTPVSEFRAKPGMAQPVYYWRPSIAVCGIDFVTGGQFPLWENYMLVTALKYEEVRLLNIHETRILHDEIILKNHGRVRDVACGPDGAIYPVLNNPGVILKLTRK
jgi:aldose sugar dehydrogenase